MENTIRLKLVDIVLDEMPRLTNEVVEEALRELREEAPEISEVDAQIYARSYQAGSEVATRLLRIAIYGGSHDGN